MRRLHSLYGAARLVAVVMLVCMAGLAVSCAEERDSWSPPYRMDFLELLTDPDGRACRAVTDQGDTLRIAGGSIPGGLRPDTVYRFIAVFTEQPAGIVISSAAKALSAPPSRLDSYEPRFDPVSVESIWRGGNYVNLTVNAKTQESRHVFGFLDRGIRDNADNGRTLSIVLYHDGGDALEAYTRKFYLSMPLYTVADSLQHGRDSIEFTVNTYSQGLHTYRLAY